jgi:hypothetical protein
MPSLRRSVRRRTPKNQPEIVTGNFELHYEDVIHRHSKMVVALFATGLIALAVFIPKAVDQSSAGVERVTVEIESGQVSNPTFVSRVGGDISAGNDTYIEFSGIPCVQQATTTCPN